MLLKIMKVMTIKDSNDYKKKKNKLKLKRENNTIRKQIDIRQSTESMTSI